MKQLIIILLTAISLTASAQKREKYEYYMDIPTYVDSIHAQLTYPLAWRNAKEDMKLKEWKKKAREQVYACMGPLPPQADAWDMKVLAEEQREGYKAQLLEFNLSRWYRVQALLLVPDKKGKLPTINLLHDHGAHLYIGKEKMIRPIARSEKNPLGADTAVVNDADRWAETLYSGQYLGDYLAKQGYVVFSIDAPLWGERGRKEGVDRKKYDIIAGNMMMLGQNLCSYMHIDDVRSTDFLATLPFVDKKRIGAAGCSMGAYRAWMLSALSDKISACASICWMTTTEAQLTTKYGRKENGGFANCIPGLRNYLDYPDIASLAAPMPMLMVNGNKDKLFQVPGAKKSFEIMQGVWNEYEKGQELDCRIEDQGHECNLNNQKEILNFFDKKFKRKK